MCIVKLSFAFSWATGSSVLSKRRNPGSGTLLETLVYSQTYLNHLRKSTGSGTWTLLIF